MMDVCLAVNLLKKWAPESHNFSGGKRWPKAISPPQELDV
jgi:hypothetical protein